MSDLLLYENPWYGQTRRHARAARLGWSRRRGLRNPIEGALGGTRRWMQGVGLMDVGVGAGSFLLANIVPNAVVKAEAGKELTGGQKFFQVVLSGGTAILMGMLCKGISPKASQFAVAGGLAATALKALGMATGGKWGIEEGRRLGTTVRGQLGQPLGESVRSPATPYESEVLVTTT